ncbi:MAG: acyltransferase [Acidaminococcaceae bacterium]|nr:acyltransferase [Acidaminococcaceae bacterium]
MSERNIVVDRLRALAMLGVIGIHIGPFVFASSTPRLDLFLLFQVFTRFAVPSFFFISGFGLFCNDALHKPFHYLNFIKKHLITVGLPYFVWSFFYIVMWQWEDMYRPDRSFSVPVLIVKFLLGEGCYHIYFMVILLYFYFSMPFWRWLVRWVSEKSAAGIAASLAVLAALQVLLYQWSAAYWNYPPWTKGHSMIIRLLNERMNYLPLFYGFVFVLGGVCAIHEKKIRSWLQCHFTSCLGIFLLSCAELVWRFKQYVLAGVPVGEIPATYMTQLTPDGLLYTVCWLLFFSAALEKLEGNAGEEKKADQIVNAGENEEASEIAGESCTQNDLAEKNTESRTTLLDVLSKYSMIIYLIHPLFLYYWLQWFELLGFSIAQVPVVVFYFLVLATSLLAGILIHELAKRCNVIGLLLLGRVPK